ncbi:hypothetical protein CEN44_17510 [Fischerella muscicola CCMEE 5323]|uniref:Uncharacterized protein n=1 Tax=Fischerella muscicola CCMEE 5323 TaxID=2019572 RepID=A0A2N6K0B7_FISMU|nr:hypothetical protein CEN44_17510 [Fischerella muscicola CCMEE 5323]
MLNVEDYWYVTNNVIVMIFTEFTLLILYQLLTLEMSLVEVKLLYIYKYWYRILKTAQLCKLSF